MYIDYKFMEITDFTSFSKEVRSAFAEHKDQILALKSTAYGTHAMVLTEYAKFAKLVTKYEFLTNVAVLLETRPNENSPIHTDGMLRPVVLNVLVSDSRADNTVTFYDIEDLIEIDIGVGAGPGVHLYHRKDKECLPVAQYSLMHNPMVVHTMAPHQINNLSNDIRWTVSFALNLTEYSQQGIYDVVNTIQRVAKHQQLKLAKDS